MYDFIIKGTTNYHNDTSTAVCGQFRDSGCVAPTDRGFLQVAFSVFSTVGLLVGPMRSCGWEYV